MPTRRLSPHELKELFAPLLSTVRDLINTASNGDPALLFALRRKLAKELTYDERGKPIHRRVLKALKRGEQDNRCAICKEQLPIENVVLDRLEAMQGYAPENTQLVHAHCDYEQQKKRRFS